MYKTVISDGPMTENYMQITPANPLIQVVVLTTKNEYIQWHMELLDEYEKRKITGLPEPVPEYSEEVTTAIVRKILTGKGYSVKSKPALLRVLRLHKVTGVRRGREKWYSTKDINRIPAMK